MNILQQVQEKLARYLPIFTEKFNDVIDIVSIVYNDTTGIAVVETATPHGLENNLTDRVNIQGAMIPFNVSLASIDGEIIATTDNPHNLTGGGGGRYKGTPDVVEFYNASNPIYNGSFFVKKRIDDFAFSIITDEIASATAQYNEASFDKLNGLYSYNVIDNTHFSYIPGGKIWLADGNTTISATGNMKLFTNFRLATVDIEDIIPEAHTHQDNQHSYWLYIVNDPFVVEKSSRATTDQTIGAQPTTYLNIRLISNISIFLYKPTAHLLGGAENIDEATNLILILNKIFVGNNLKFNFEGYTLDSFAFTGAGVPNIINNGDSFIYKYTYEYVIRLDNNIEASFDDTYAVRKMQLNSKIRDNIKTAEIL